MIEFFLSSVDFAENAYTTIYYTGKRKLCIDALDLPPTVFVFEQRPNLETAIRDTIHAIETGAGLPEETIAAAAAVAAAAFAESDALRRKEASDDPVTKATAAMRRALLSDDVDGVMDLFRAEGGGAPVASSGLDAAGLAAVCRTQGLDLSAGEAAAVVAAYDVDGDGHISPDELRRKLEAEASSPAAAAASPRSPAPPPVLAAEASVGSAASDAARAIFDPAETDDDISKGAFLRAVPEDRLRAWQILYCGGAQRVVDALSSFCEDHHLSFRKEKFDW